MDFMGYDLLLGVLPALAGAASSLGTLIKWVFALWATNKAIGIVTDYMTGKLSLDDLVSMVEAKKAASSREVMARVASEERLKEKADRMLERATRSAGLDSDSALVSAGASPFHVRPDLYRGLRGTSVAGNDLDVLSEAVADSLPESKSGTDLSGTDLSGTDLSGTAGNIDRRLFGVAAVPMDTSIVDILSHFEGMGSDNLDDPELFDFLSSGTQNTQLSGVV